MLLILLYINIIILEYRICNDGYRSFIMDRDRDADPDPFPDHDPPFVI